VAAHQTNPLALAALATAAIPGLEVVSASLDAVGADYAYALLEDSSERSWVVRMPLHDTANSHQDAEVKLLRSLAGASSGGALPFEVPRPRGFATLEGGGEAMVYSQLPGVPVVLELMDPGPGVAESLGRAVAAFHQLPSSLVTDAGLPAYTPAEYRARLRKEVDDAAHSGHVTGRLEDRWRRQLDIDAWWVFTPVPIHGDMAVDHLLEYSGRISAMSDFASVAVSDPAEDLAQLLAPLPPDVAGTVVGAYRQRRAELDDPHLEDRAAFLGEMAIIRWLLHGLALEDPDIVRDAREMLADLDRAVQVEEAEAERQAAAEEEARVKLEAAKQAAEEEARERRAAAVRASEAAARDRLRSTGSVDRVESEAAEPGSPSEDEEPAWMSEAAEVDGLVRKPVTPDGASVWGSPRAVAPSWEEAVLGKGPEGESDMEQTAAMSPADLPPNEDIAPSEEASNSEPAPDSAEAAGQDESPAPVGAAKPEPVVDSAPDAPTAQPAAAVAKPAQAETDSMEMTQAYLPDFLKDDSEAPADIRGASQASPTERIDRDALPKADES
jgi:hypothetical protein